MLVPGEQIVDLQQVEPWHAPEPAGGFDLRWATRAGRRPDLVGGEEAWRWLELGEAVADDVLRRAIHRRGVDHVARPARRTRASPPRRHPARTGSSPTLKVIQLPSPTRGRISPDEGMGFVRIAGDWPRTGGGGTTAATPAAKNLPRAARRLMLIGSVILHIHRARSMRVDAALGCATTARRLVRGGAVHAGPPVAEVSAAGTTFRSGRAALARAAEEAFGVFCTRAGLRSSQPVSQLLLWPARHGLTPPSATISTFPESFTNCYTTPVITAPATRLGNWLNSA